MDSFHGHHRLRQHESCLQRRRTSDCSCVWTTELSMKPLWRTDTLTHWSLRCAEPGSPWESTPGTPITLRESRKATRTKLRSEHGPGSWSTKSCCSGWWTNQLFSKPISTTAYSLTLTTSQCATVMIYWSNQPMRGSTNSKYDKCSSDHEKFISTAKPKSAVLESQWSAFSNW